MDKDSQIKALQANIERNKEFVITAQCLERLLQNRDFQTVVKKGYFEQEAIRLVHLKSDPAHQTPEKQASIIKQIDAIGNLRSYFDVIVHNANSALSSIDNDELTIQDLNVEGDE